jgi:hypothetical protein
MVAFYKQGIASAKVAVFLQQPCVGRFRNRLLVERLRGEEVTLVAACLVALEKLVLVDFLSVVGLVRARTTEDPCERAEKPVR